MATPIPPNAIIAAKIVWKNVGNAPYKPRFRINVTKGGFWDSPLEGAWVESVETAPDQSAEVNPYLALPNNSQWWTGTKISIRILLDGISGAAVPDFVDYYIISAPDVSWVQIISVTPYVQM